MEFEWDNEKAVANFGKHGVRFEEASSVFGDALAITFNDPLHSVGEHRFLIFGVSHTGLLLVVSFAERGRRIRIISARKAARTERKIYEEDQTH
ncbi:MAG TPA: BrnT family toxin [Candidatus Hydrogenedentes bacterium]|nr:BrnT family toxin [Candidatus Hydrogenedentota bacterium]